MTIVEESVVDFRIAIVADPGGAESGSPVAAPRSPYVELDRLGKLVRVCQPIPADPVLYSGLGVYGINFARFDEQSRSWTQFNTELDSVGGRFCMTSPTLGIYALLGDDVEDAIGATPAPIASQTPEPTSTVGPATPTPAPVSTPVYPDVTPTPALGLIPSVTPQPEPAATPELTPTVTRTYGLNVRVSLGQTGAASVRVVVVRPEQAEATESALQAPQAPATPTLLPTCGAGLLAVLPLTAASMIPFRRRRSRRA